MNAMIQNLFAVTLLFVFVDNLISQLLEPPKKIKKAMLKAIIALVMGIQIIKFRNSNKKKE